MKRRVLPGLGSLISVCLFAAAAVVIHHKPRGYRLHDIARQTERIPAGALLMALVITVANYLVLTASDALALKYIRHPLRYRKLALASFIGYVFSYNATIIGGSTGVVTK